MNEKLYCENLHDLGFRSADFVCFYKELFCVASKIHILRFFQLPAQSRLYIGIVVTRPHKLRAPLG